MTFWAEQIYPASKQEEPEPDSAILQNLNELMDYPNAPLKIASIFVQQSIEQLQATYSTSKSYNTVPKLVLLQNNSTMELIANEGGVTYFYILIQTFSHRYYLFI